MVDQITADELADRIDRGQEFTLVDTRPEESYDAWRLPGAENVPFDPSEGLTEAALNRMNALADRRPVVAICAKGLTSTSFAFELEEHGYDEVAVVKGGMEDWSEVYETVSVGTPDSDLVIRQLQRRGTGCLGYVVGSRESGEAVVVDPTRQTDEFAVAAEEAGLTVTAVLDTHVHADHISGGPKLAEALSVPYRLGERARERGVEREYEPVADDETIRVGDHELTAIEAPGHTTEMVNYRVDDRALLTGDTLFVESVGRTELQFGEDDAVEGAELLYESLHGSILDHPPDMLVLPGHVSVTPDGRYEHGTPGEPITARLGDLREGLDVLGLGREPFVERIAENGPEKPSNYETIIGINLGKTEVRNEGETASLELGPNSCAA